MKEGSQQAKKERDIKSGNQEIKENKKEPERENKEARKKLYKR